MNRLNFHISKKGFTLAFGVMLAMAIMVTQSVSFLYQTDVNSMIGDVAQSDDEDHSTHHFLTVDAIAAAPSVQLNLDKPFQVVFEFFLSEDDEPEAEPVSLPLIENFLKILFRLTISPNAP